MCLKKLKMNQLRFEMVQCICAICAEYIDHCIFDMFAHANKYKVTRADGRNKTKAGGIISFFLPIQSLLHARPCCKRINDNFECLLLLYSM